MNIILGTAQVGQSYGATNRNGALNLKELNLILDVCRRNDIFCIDTASMYGKSEQILGDSDKEGFLISTKLKSFDKTEFNSETVFMEIVNSITKLKIEMIDTLFLHRPDEILSGKGYEIKIGIQKAFEQGLINKVGISVYSSEQIKIISEELDFSVVQAPVNFFDRRIINNEGQEFLNTNKIELQARSIFLQGILLSSIKDLQPFFLQYSSIFKSWNKFLERNSISALDACIHFVKNMKISSCVIGVTNNLELVEIINSFKKNIELSKSAEFHDLPEKLINPSLWEI